MGTWTRVGKNVSAMALGIAMLGAQAVRAQEDTVVRLQAEATASPERLELGVSLGNAAAAAGKLDLALASYGKVLAKLDPDSEGAADLYLRIGEVQRRKGDLTAAAQSLTRASVMQPDNPAALGTLAMVLEATGRVSEAVKAYRKVIQLDAENSVALNNLALLLSNSAGDLDEALALARRAQRVEPLDPDIADTVGSICLKKNLADDAIRAFAASIAREPDQAGFRYHIAMAYAQKGDRPAAIEQLNQALTGMLGENEREGARQLLAVLEK